MTTPVLANADTDVPACSPITFIMRSSDRLLTVRYADPLPFRTVRKTMVTYSCGLDGAAT